MIILEPENTYRITEMWAFISQDDNGNEGILGFDSPLGISPMMTTSPKVLESFRPIAVALASETGKKILLIKLTHRTDVEEIGGHRH